MNRLKWGRGDMRGVEKKGVRIVLRRDPVSETGGMAEIGQTGCDGRESFPSQKPNCLVSAGLSVHTPLSAGHSPSCLSLTLIY